jgi:Tfp pilus assembly protein PilO
MAKSTSFTKRTMITQANKKILVMTSVAAFLVVFSLVAAKILVGQIAYQNKVISHEKLAQTQLETDLGARTSLVNSYQAFINTPQNVLGGNPSGTGSQDGSNSKIVLDALPSTYDFPALASTLEALIKSQNLQISSITGTDEELTEQDNQSSASPVPVAMPFSFSVNGSYQDVQNLISIMQASIRPIQIQTIDISGSQSDMTATIAAQTYYQPQKVFTVTKQGVQ